jgi:hypothetical protein
MKNFFKSLGKGLKHTGTTVWGGAAVVALAVNQQPAILQVFLSKEDAAMGRTVAGFVAAIAGMTAAAKAADADKTPKE